MEAGGPVYPPQTDECVQPRSRGLATAQVPECAQRFWEPGFGRQVSSQGSSCPAGRWAFQAQLLLII